MQIARAAALLAMAQAIAMGCAKRNAPYRFRAPLVSSVHADEVSGQSPRRGARSPATPLLTEKRAPLGGSLADALRRLVGERRKQHTQVQFVTEALSTIGARIHSTLRAAATGDSLVSAARQRSAATVEVAPLLGDIAVFERVYRKQPSPVLGVVVASDERGTVEFVYLARGVVRRGFVNLQHRDAKRDQTGRILNTILRQKDGHSKKGYRDLTSVLFSTYLRLDRLGS